MGLGPKPAGTAGFTTGTVSAAGSAILNDYENKYSDSCSMPSWQIVTDLCGGTAVWTVDGHPTGFDMSNPEQGVVTADIAVKISGRPVLVVK